MQGLSFQNCSTRHITSNDKKSIKGPFSSGSTLMRPTASLLAKQNRQREGKFASRPVHRFQKMQVQQSERSVEDPSVNGVQAAKRQKLDSGHSRKIAGVEQQTQLMHKVLQKNKTPPDYNSHHTKLRITIPREPELQTTQRAQRLRVQRSNDDKQSQEGKAQAIPIFKAHPLNRKILKAPSLPLTQRSTLRLPEFQTFDLQTDKRAHQRLFGGPSSLISKNNIPASTLQHGKAGSTRFQFQASGPSQLKSDDQKLDKYESVLPFFKARPLNKKVLSSKGDIGVFRSTKREATVPVEFKFSTKERFKQEPPTELLEEEFKFTRNKIFKQDPPTELLNKMSLNTKEGKAPSQAKLIWPSLEDTKDTKENITDCAQQGDTDNNISKEFPRPGVMQIDAGSGVIPDYRSKIYRFRSSRIR